MREDGGRGSLGRGRSPPEVTRDGPTRPLGGQPEGLVDTQDDPRQECRVPTQTHEQVPRAE